jgi:hypothetical protein
MTNDPSIPSASDSPHPLGQLLLRQTGATLYRSLLWLLVAVVCFGSGLVMFTLVSESLPIDAPLAFILVGLLCLVSVAFGRIKLIECYEKGVIVRKPFKSFTVLHKDVAAVQFLAVRKYGSGIYQGTISHFTIMPMLDKTINIRIHGSRRDSDRIWTIAQTILRLNPDARLEELL